MLHLMCSLDNLPSKLSFPPASSNLKASGRFQQVLDSSSGFSSRRLQAHRAKPAKDGKQASISAHCSSVRDKSGAMAKSRERSGPIKNKKRDLKMPMGVMSQKQRPGKRSSGKESRKKFPFSRTEIASPGSCRKVVGKKPPQRLQWRLQVEMMELEAQLAQMKEDIRD